MTSLLQPGEPATLLVAAAGAENGAAFALPLRDAIVISWMYSFASPPASAISVKLQVSDDGNLWTDLDAGTNNAGETRTSLQTGARFVRGIVVSQTGGGTVTISAVATFV